MEFKHVPFDAGLEQYEQQAAALLEAFKAGCPVIAYLAAAIPETMGSAGIGMDESDPALAAGLIELVRRDRASRKRIIAAQSARAMHFRSEATAQRWVELFEDGMGLKLGAPRHADRV